MNTPNRSGYQLKTRWIIRGTLTTTTTMHIGSGASELNENLKHDPDDSASELAMANLVVRDHNGKPYLPGSALKGVLKHYAERCNADDQARKVIFGEHGGKIHANHFAGFVDFLPAWLKSAPAGNMLKYTQAKVTGIIAASARERTTKAVAAKKLFHHEAVPAGAVFDVELHAEDLEAKDIAILLSLLQGFSKEPNSLSLGAKQATGLLKRTYHEIIRSPLSLGAKQATGLGVMVWKPKTIKRLTPEKAKQWWNGVRNGFSMNLDEPSPDRAKEIWKNSVGIVIPPWENFADEIGFDVDGSNRPVLKLPGNKVVVGVSFSVSDILPIATSIAIDGPFLVSEPVEKQNGNNANLPNYVPRRTHDGMIEFPGSSLHGALRSQAERICRTLGLDVPEGHKVSVYKAKKQEDQDIVSWLFGAPGWRSVLCVESFIAKVTGELPTQDFVALDRFHGGVSGSAKFKVGYVLNPVLAGTMNIDMRRLKLSDNHKAALGLLALTLRDLDEGDIPLGYGAAAKGYGQVDTGKTKTFDALEQQLLQVKVTVDDAVAAFRKYCKSIIGVLPKPLTTTGSPEPLYPIENPTGNFHNPYAFLPVDKPREMEKWTSRADFDQRNLGHHSHARYALKDADGNPVYSGRIVCRLKNNTPLVIGGKQDERRGDNPATVHPFELGGQLALPATSLRGMIGLIIEAASQSSMRVLEDRQLSVRREVGKALSAMGRIVKYNGSWRLEPLCLPTLAFHHGSTIAIIPKEFNQMFPDGNSVPFKALFGDRRNQTPANSKTDFFEQYASDSNSASKCFHLEVNSIQIQSGRFNFSDRKNELHIKPSAPAQGHKPAKRGYILGYRVNPHVLPDNNLANQSGIVRVMHHDARAEELPRNRKHEVWLPMTNEQLSLPTTFSDQGITLTEEQEKIRQYYLDKTFPIDRDAIERFEALADERTESQDNEHNLSSEAALPFHPLGTQRNNGEVTTTRKTFKKKERALRLKPGDIVYFRPSESDNPSKNGNSVAEVAYSSIWRSRIEIETKNGSEKKVQSYGVHSFFKSIDPDLLPFNSDRTKISPAEWMLGFTSTDKKDPKNKDSVVSAFAGKLRLSFGLSDSASLAAQYVPLKILASPKPPSPAMYFKPKGGSGYVSKPKLAKEPGECVPNGRKVYLHALREEDQITIKGLSNIGSPETLNEGASANEPWRSRNRDNNNQKVQVKPIEKHSEFWFHIDFDNLDQSELELLCFALQPCEKYEHRLGMGRPLGLGSVSVIPEALLLVDRSARYGADSCARATHRYHAIWQKPARQTNGVHARYIDALAATSVAGYTSPAAVSDLSQAGAEKVKQLSEALWRAIVLTGRPDAVKKPVHTPQKNPQNLESENLQVVRKQ